MKDVLRSTCMAFSMFSALPTPRVEWKESNMKYMLCALPLVGAFIGAFLLLWHKLCVWLGIGSVLYAAGMTLIPVAVSGGIHMDGFCDTVDALASHAPAEKKRAILKDSHAGAFAIIFTVGYFVLYFALCTETGYTLSCAAVLALYQVFSRAVGAFAGVVLPSSSARGLLSSFKNASAKKAAAILVIWCLLCAAGLTVLYPVSGLVCTAVAAVSFWYLKSMSQKQFGGMSGDLAGYIITLLQLVFLVCFVFVQKAVVICF